MYKAKEFYYKSMGEIDLSNIFKDIENIVGDFQNKVMEIQALIGMTIKIAIVIIVACFVIYLIREYLNWRMQVKLQRQNEELLEKMTQIILLLEKSMKNK